MRRDRESAPGGMYSSCGKRAESSWPYTATTNT